MAKGRGSGGPAARFERIVSEREGGPGPPKDDAPAPRRGLQAGFQPRRRLETKQEAWVRLVNARVAKFDETIGSIGKLSNPDVYAYSQENVDRLFAYLRSCLDAIEQGFRGGRKRSAFRLEVDPNLDSK